MIEYVYNSIFRTFLLRVFGVLYTILRRAARIAAVTIRRMPSRAKKKKQQTNYKKTFLIIRFKVFK